MHLALHIIEFLEAWWKIHVTFIHCRTKKNFYFNLWGSVLWIRQCGQNNVNNFIDNVHSPGHTHHSWLLWYGFATPKTFLEKFNSYHLQPSAHSYFMLSLVWFCDFWKLDDHHSRGSMREWENLWSFLLLFIAISASNWLPTPYIS